jgi:hypothetical protein
MPDKPFLISIYLLFDFFDQNLIFYDPTDNRFYDAREPHVYNLDTIKQWGEELEIFTVNKCTLV